MGTYLGTLCYSNAGSERLLDGTKAAGLRLAEISEAENEPVSNGAARLSEASVGRIRGYPNSRAPSTPVYRSTVRSDTGTLIASE